MTRAVRAIISLLAFELFVRSVDYLTGDSYNARNVEDNLSVPEVWGLFGLAAVIIVALGLFSKRAGVVQAGCVTSFAIYTMFAVQIFELRMLPIPWPPEDTRFLTSHLTLAGLWLLMALVIWWRAYIAKKCADELDRKVQGE